VIILGIVFLSSDNFLLLYGGNFRYVVYWAPVSGPRSPRIAYRQSLWLADMWHAYWAAGSDPSKRHHGRKQSKWRRRSSD